LDYVLREGLDGSEVAKEASAKSEPMSRIVLTSRGGGTQDRLGSTLDGFKALVSDEPLKAPLYTLVVSQLSPLDLRNYLRRNSPHRDRNGEMLNTHQKLLNIQIRLIETGTRRTLWKDDGT